MRKLSLQSHQPFAPLVVPDLLLLFRTTPPQHSLCPRNQLRPCECHQIIAMHQLLLHEPAPRRGILCPGTPLPTSQSCLCPWPKLVSCSHRPSTVALSAGTLDSPLVLLLPETCCLCVPSDGPHFPCSQWRAICPAWPRSLQAGADQSLLGWLHRSLEPGFSSLPSCCFACCCLPPWPQQIQLQLLLCTAHNACGTLLHSIAF